MSKQISLTLDEYKDKDLPLTIMVNGHTYYSQYSLATEQNKYYEMGKADGKELGKYDKDTSEIKLHTEWYDKGYMEEQLDNTYNEGYIDGFEAGKKDGISEIKSHTDMNHLHHLWYDKGYNAGKLETNNHTFTDKELERLWRHYLYTEGHNDGYELGKKELGVYDVTNKYIADMKRHESKLNKVVDISYRFNEIFDKIDMIETLLLKNSGSISL